MRSLFLMSAVLFHNQSILAQELWQGQSIDRMIWDPVAKDIILCTSRVELSNSPKGIESYGTGSVVSLRFDGRKVGPERTSSLAFKPSLIQKMAFVGPNKVAITDWSTIYFFDTSKQSFHESAKTLPHIINDFQLLGETLCATGVTEDLKHAVTSTWEVEKGLKLKLIETVRVNSVVDEGMIVIPDTKQNRYFAITRSGVVRTVEKGGRISNEPIAELSGGALCCRRNSTNTLALIGGYRGPNALTVYGEGFTKKAVFACTENITAVDFLDDTTVVCATCIGRIGIGDCRTGKIDFNQVHPKGNCVGDIAYIAQYKCVISSDRNGFLYKTKVNPGQLE